MANTISPNMKLVIPGVGTEPSPNWANDLNASLTSIDSHNHSSNQGVQIQPNGLNINSDLSFQSNNAINLRTTRFIPQLSPITNAGLEVGEVYVSGNELYYNDVTGGHQVQITNSGSVNAGAGSISGLPSGTASASYNAGTFVWQEATSTAANMDFGSAVFRNNTASSNGITVSAPSALAASSNFVLPIAPASATSFLQMDTSGNVTASIATLGALTTSNLSATAGITRGQQAAVGQQVSLGSGSFTTSSTSYVNVTNMSVTITTSGRPVQLFVQPSGGGPSNINVSGNLAPIFMKLNGCVNTVEWEYTPLSTSAFVQLPSMTYLDLPAAGTITYTVQVRAPSANTIAFNNASLVAYEL